MKYKQFSPSESELMQLLSEVNRIALVGASHKPIRPSYEVMSFLQQQDYQVTPINPGLAGQTLLGEYVYRSISELPDKVDMIDIFRNSAAVTQLTEEILALPKELRPKLVWMQIGVTNEAAAELLQEQGITVVMDRCPKRVIQANERITSPVC